MYQKVSIKTQFRLLAGISSSLELPGNPTDVVGSIEPPSSITFDSQNAFSLKKSRTSNAVCAISKIVRIAAYAYIHTLGSNDVVKVAPGITQQKLVAIEIIQHASAIKKQSIHDHFLNQNSLSYASLVLLFLAQQ